MTCSLSRLWPLAAAALLAAAPLAGAEGHGGWWSDGEHRHGNGEGRHARAAMPATVPKAYTQECASCHTAYPPGMLPAASWQRIMNGLSHHYGTDASIDPANVRLLAGWLRQNAGTDRRTATPPPQDRITRTAWFEHKHREIPAGVWRLASVKSPANCTACHRGAERGVFSEHDLRVPAGMTPAQQRAFYD